MKKAVPGKLVQARNGGRIWRGAPANPVAGTGRPPDAIRAKMRELGYEKALPFIEEVLDGKVTLSLLGKCDACAHEQKISQEWLELLMDRLQASRDDRIRVSDMLFKHGLQSKDLVIAFPQGRQFFDCVNAAIVELYGDEAAQLVEARAKALVAEIK